MTNVRANSYARNETSGTNGTKYAWAAIDGDFTSYWHDRWGAYVNGDTDAIKAAGVGLQNAIQNAAAFELSAASISDIEIGGSASIEIAPKAGLGAAAYSAAVYITGENGISAGFAVSFTVNPARYTITVRTDGNGAASASHTTAAAGQTVILSTVPANGYRFKEWMVIELESPIIEGTFVMPAKDVTVTAMFEPIPETVKPEDPKPENPSNPNQGGSQPQTPAPGGTTGGGNYSPVPTVTAPAANSDGDGKAKTDDTAKADDTAKPAEKPAAAVVTGTQAAKAAENAANALGGSGAKVVGEMVSVTNITAPVPVVIAKASEKPSGGSVYAVLAADGTLTPVPSYTNPITGEVTVLATVSGVYVSVDGAAKGYNDVKPADWFAGAISQMTAALITGGDGDGNFRPNAPAKLAEMVKMFENAIGLPAAPGKPGDKWYSGAMSAAETAGLAAKGAKPENTGTRAEAAEMIVVALKIAGISLAVTEQDIAKVSKDFTDLGDLTKEEREAFALCYKLGIFNGYGDFTMRPHGKLTRAEMATITLKLRDEVVKRQLIK